VRVSGGSGGGAGLAGALSDLGSPADIDALLVLGDLAGGMTPDIDRERMPLLQSLQQHGAVQNAVEELPIEEKTILRLRYGVLQDDELTLRDIGEILGLSRERVRQIESRAEAKCRRSVKRR